MPKILAASVLIASMLCCSCAVSYHPISAERTSSIQSAQAGEVAFSAGPKSLESNPRIASKAEMSKIKFIGIDVENNSRDTIRISRTGVSLEGGNESYQGIAPESAFDPLRFWVYGYWLYSLIWFGSTSCSSESGCSSFWLPVGLPISIINVVTASNSNTEFLRDIKSNQIYDMVIGPGQTKSGMAYFQRTGNARYDVRIVYLRNQVQETVTIKSGL